MEFKFWARKRDTEVQQFLTDTEQNFTGVHSIEEHMASMSELAQARLVVESRRKSDHMSRVCEDSRKSLGRCRFTEFPLRLGTGRIEALRINPENLIELYRAKKSQEAYEKVYFRVGERAEVKTVFPQ